MKKIVSILLTLVLAMSTVTYAVFANEQTDKGALISVQQKGLDYFKNIAKDVYTQEGTYSTVNVYNTAIIAGANKLNDPDFDFMKADCSGALLNASSQSTEYAGQILTAYMLGQDPTNLVSELAKRQNADGAFPFVKNSNEIVLVNDTIWAIIALSQTDYKYDYEKSINYLKSVMRADGGYNFAGDDSESSVDVTAMALIALSQYKENAIAKELITKATAFLSSKLDVDGKFIGDYNSKNSCTQSTAILGLISIGEDVKGDKWTKNGNNICDILLAYQGENGGFWYDYPPSFYTEPDEFSSKQSLVAIDALITNKVIFTDIKNRDFSNNNSSSDSSIEESSNLSNSDNNTQISSDNSANSNPNSGDSGVQIFVILIVISLLALVALLFFKKAGKGKKDNTQDNDIK